MPYFRASSGLRETSPFEARAVTAERVRELDDDLAVRRGSEVPELHPVEPVRVDAAQPRPEAIRLAASADPGQCGYEGEAGDEQAERRAEDVRSEGVREGCASEHADSHHVGEARRPRIFHGSFAEARLHELEVSEAREAETPAEGEPDRQLRRQKPEDEPPARENGGEREDADGRLVEAWRARVDDVEVTVRVGGPRSLHFLKLTASRAR
jgi:hypothetical protein